MSPAIPGLVQTSTNLGDCLGEPRSGEIGSASVAPSRVASTLLRAMVATACPLAGFEVEHAGVIRDGSRNRTARSSTSVRKCLWRFSAADTRLGAMHAGLECGVIGEKYPGMQLISLARRSKILTARTSASEFLRSWTSGNT